MNAPAPDPLIGRVLDGKYRIVERIGGGGMGTVYRALHLTLGAPRAAKVMRRELADDASFVERFQREARVVESLRHPNLVSLYDFGQLPDGIWYIVSEFVEGVTLASGVRRPSAEVAHLLGQVADGLALAHRKGIVHRDLSPDNIMVTRDEDGADSAKLLDFGVAKALGAVRGTDGTDSSLFFGKIGYASPEQMGLLGAGEELDARSDVFSLAAVAIEMLSGQLPWRKDGVQSYVHDLIVRPEAQIRERIATLAPPSWVPALTRALARDRASRTPDVLTFKAAMRAVVERAAGVETSGGVIGRRALLAGGLAGAGVVVLALVNAPWRDAPAAPLPAPPPSSSPAMLRSSAPPSSAAAAPPSLESREAPVVVARTPPAPPVQPTPSPSAVAAPVMAPAQLVLESDPTAVVQLDGTRRGRTPLAITALAEGPHQLVLTTDDGRVHEEPVEVRPGETLRRTHRFPGFGGLSVASDVWLEVSVDGGPAQQTPCRFERLLAGRHVVRATRAGYRERVVEAEIREGEMTALRLTPER
jgi:eukaryotic-like serine/threonine-protein kinase